MEATVWVFAGLDPSGGAGLSADIESCIAFEVRACPFMTANTVQNSAKALSVSPVSAEFLKAQIEHMENDMPIDAIKIGLIGHVDILDVLLGLIQRYPNVPVILDPVLKASHGSEFANEQLIERIAKELVPLCTCITPNRAEARQLQPYADIFSQTQVLLTGADESETVVPNELFNPDSPNTATLSWDWPKLPDSYHGSGCTLASAIAALIARGHSVETATGQAQKWVYQTLMNATKPGKEKDSQWLPERNL